MAALFSDVAIPPRYMAYSIASLLNVGVGAIGSAARVLNGSKPSAETAIFLLLVSTVCIFTAPTSFLDFSNKASVNKVIDASVLPGNNTPSITSLTPRVMVLLLLGLGSGSASST